MKSTLLSLDSLLLNAFSTMLLSEKYTKSSTYRPNMRGGSFGSIFPLNIQGAFGHWERPGCFNNDIALSNQCLGDLFSP